MTKEEAVRKFLVLYVDPKDYERASRTLLIIIDMFEIRGELKGARETASELVAMVNEDKS